MTGLFSFSVEASKDGKERGVRWVKGEGTVLTGSFILKGLKNPARERGEVYYEEAPATGIDKIRSS